MLPRSRRGAAVADPRLIERVASGGGTEQQLRLLFLQAVSTSGGVPMVRSTRYVAMLACTATSARLPFTSSFKFSTSPGPKL